jgi:hypothetical protein
MKPPPSSPDDSYAGYLYWLLVIPLSIAAGVYFGNPLLSVVGYFIVGITLGIFKEVIQPRLYQRRYQMWLSSPDGQAYQAEQARRQKTELRGAYEALREADEAWKKEEENRRAEFAREARAKGFWLDLSPTEFESKVGELFRAAGYNVRVTPASNDAGIDLRLEKQGSCAIVQCKRFRTGNVSRPDVQQFYGVLMADECMKEGFFVTTAGFTDGAIEFTNKIQKPIHLIDVEKLIKMSEGTLSEEFIRSGPSGQLVDSGTGRKKRR